MNPEWLDFLRQQDADIRDGIAHHFGSATAEMAAARDGMILCDLSRFGTLKVSGEDAHTFLNNLLSSDVREINAQRAQLSSLNNPKGRMLASLLIWRTGADYFLHLPHELCAAIQQHLTRYILRAKVKIEDVSEQQICIGVAGSGASALLLQHLGSFPQAIWAVDQHAQVGVIRVGEQRFQINTSPQNAPDLWKKLAADARPVGSLCWDWLSIRAGLPVIVPATQEQFVAQMVNLELLGGVSFKKGCYPGQEIVARMQYLGKLKRRMYLAHIAENTMPQAGDELYSADMEGQASGMVVNATPAPEGGCDLLAVVQISSRETQPVHLQSLQGAALQFLPLPYAL